MAAPGRVVVVGLGPAGADHLLPIARDALERAPHRFVRTERHPAVDDLRAAGLALEAFDDRYEAADEVGAVYPAIVDALVDAAAVHGEVAYAVPGSPAVAERSVVLLREAAAAGRVELEVVPGLSFAELAWTRLGVDPMAGARVVDGRDLDPGALDVGGPVLVAQVDGPLVLSDVKLALLERLAPDEPVTVVQRLGLAGERVVTMPVAELDRVVPDHLTAVLVPGTPGSPAAEVARLLALAERLRAPGGCPWDAEQTHHSLARHLLEESYEVIDALERLPADAPAGADPLDPAYVDLVDELGDLLYQVVFHAVLAREAGAFGLADVARGIHDKLVRRHPHVFGTVEAGTSAEVVRNWEQIKKEEKGVESLVAGITPGLPSLLYAHKLLRKAESIGLGSGDLDEAAAGVERSVAHLRDDADVERLVGDLLAAGVAFARAGDVDAETALRGWTTRFRARFEAMEALASARGVDLHRIEPAAVRALWDDAALSGG